MSNPLSKLLPGRDGHKKATRPAEVHTLPPTNGKLDGNPDVAADADTRRGFIGKIGIVATGLSLGLPAAFSVRSLVPNVLYEKPMRAKLGKADAFADGATYLPQERVFVFRDKSTFHCISARCTHLGCTVQLAKLEGNDPKALEFRCPCHGSKYHVDGVNYAGPAPKPLDHFSLELAADDGQLVVDMSKTVARDWRFTV